MLRASQKKDVRVSLHIENLRMHSIDVSSKNQKFHRKHTDANQMEKALKMELPKINQNKHFLIDTAPDPKEKARRKGMNTCTNF